MPFEVRELLDRIDDRQPLGASHNRTPGRKKSRYSWDRHVAMGGQRVGHKTHIAPAALRVVDQRNAVDIDVALSRGRRAWPECAWRLFLPAPFGPTNPKNVPPTRTRTKISSTAPRLAEVPFEVDDLDVHHGSFEMP